MCPSLTPRLRCTTDAFHKADFGGAPRKLARMQTEFLLDCNISGAQTIVLSMVKGKE
jgi:hypothetical protein